MLSTLFWILTPQTPYTIKADGVPPATLKRVETALEKGRTRIERYFGRPFPSTFPVIVSAHRADFDKATAFWWRMPPSEKWMVGAGSARVLILLSPNAWQKEAVEHDGSSDRELDEIIAHELTHVYHGQMNPRPEFDGMDDMGWFVEGLATLVSGQYDAKFRPVATGVIRDGTGPGKLAEAWVGRARYAVAGSMVRLIEVTYGRDVILQLTRTTSNKQALNMLGVSESEFLKKWRASTP